MSSDDTSGSQVAGRDRINMDSEHDSDRYVHVLLSGDKCVALSSRLRPSFARTVVVQQNSMRISKSFMVDTIKVHLTKLLGMPPSGVNEQKF